jgi:mono/diheme cytochrome c family protein
LRSRFQPSLLLVTGSSLLVIALLFAAGCNSESKAAPPKLTAQQERGRQAFQANCAVCHNAYKNEPLQGPPLVNLYKKDLPSGKPPTDPRVRESIMLGRNTMPAFNLLLSDDQVNDLIAYLHSL